MFKLIGKLIKYTIYGSIAVIVLAMGLAFMFPTDSSTNIATNKETVEDFIKAEEDKELKAKQLAEEKALKELEKAKKAEEKAIAKAKREEEKAIAKAKREEEKAIAKAKREEEKRIAEQKKIEEELAKEKLLAEQKAEEKRKGFHCLSSWDGSHRAVANWTKKQLREPKSFKHINTLVWPVDTQGNHQLVMQYKAKNGFGGMTSGVVKAFYSNSDCGATIKSID